jgi:hypothetical protein
MIASSAIRTDHERYARSSQAVGQRAGQNLHDHQLNLTSQLSRKARTELRTPAPKSCGRLAPPRLAGT